LKIKSSDIKAIVRPAEILLIMAIVVISSFIAHQRNLVWKDDYTLWSDCVEKSYEKARPYNNLAIAYRSKGLIDP